MSHSFIPFLPHYSSIHALRGAYTHRLKLTRTHVHTDVRSYIYIYDAIKYTHTHPETMIQAQTHKQTSTITHTRSQSHKYRHTHTVPVIQLQTYTHGHSHTSTHKQTHTNVNVLRLKSFANCSEGDYAHREQKRRLILHLVKPEIVARCIMAWFFIHQIISKFSGGREACNSKVSCGGSSYRCYRTCKLHH